MARTETTAAGPGIQRWGSVRIRISLLRIQNVSRDSSNATALGISFHLIACWVRDKLFFSGGIPTQGACLTFDSHGVVVR